MSLTLYLSLITLSLKAARPPFEELRGVRSSVGLWVELELDRLPTLQERELLREHGVELHEFVTGTRYWCLVKHGALERTKRLRGKDNRTIYQFPSQGGSKALSISTVLRRVSDVLQSAIIDGNPPSWAVDQSGLWAMDLLYRSGVEPSEVERFLSAAGCRIVHHSGQFQLVSFLGTQSAALALAEEPWVASIGFVAPPMEFHQLEYQDCIER